MPRPTIFRQAALGLALWIAGAGAASAGSFAVSPVRATLSAQQPVGSLTVRNDGDEATVVQLEVVGWTQQQGGRDSYAPTKEILATPPIFTVPPGGMQTVRVGLRRAPDAQQELTYRLYLQEVPPPPKPGFQGMQVALRIGVPVFVAPPVPAKPVLRWQAARAPDGGSLRLTLTNSGNAHVQVANFRLALPGGAQPLATQDVAAYVLPGQSRDWSVKVSPLPAAGTTLGLAAQTDAGDAEATVVVER